MRSFASLGAYNYANIRGSAGWQTPRPPIETTSRSFRDTTASGNAICTVLRAPCRRERPRRAERPRTRFVCSRCTDRNNSRGIKQRAILRALSDAGDCARTLSHTVEPSSLCGASYEDRWFCIPAEPSAHRSRTSGAPSSAPHGHHDQHLQNHEMPRRPSCAYGSPSFGQPEQLGHASAPGATARAL